MSFRKQIEIDRCFQNGLSQVDIAKNNPKNSAARRDALFFLPNFGHIIHSIPGSEPDPVQTKDVRNLTRASDEVELFPPLRAAAEALYTYIKYQ